MKRLIRGLAFMIATAGLVPAGTAMGAYNDLRDVTGNTYNWMAYNLAICSDDDGDGNGLGADDGYGGQTLSGTTNVTGYTYDHYAISTAPVQPENAHYYFKYRGYGGTPGDAGAGSNTFGTLTNYLGGGAISGVKVRINNTTNSDWLANNVSDGMSVNAYNHQSSEWYTTASPDPIFAVPIGAKYGGAWVGLGGGGRYGTIMFTGLNHTQLYDFAGIAISGIRKNDDYYKGGNIDFRGTATIQIFANSFTQGSTQSAKAYAAYTSDNSRVYGNLPAMSSNTMTLTLEDDDRAMWTDILPYYNSGNPSDPFNNTIRITMTHVSGREGVGFSAFVLGEQGVEPPAAPTITNTAPSSITSSSASMNGNLTSTGGVPTFVWLYWGTNDGKNTNNNWQHTNSFGQRRTGLLATNIAGLSGSTTYYYRYYATNSAGATWATPSTNFATLPTPVIVNSAATNITTNSAFMNGNLNSTGGVPTFVWLYWGTNDGKNTNNNWQHTNSFGQCAVGVLTTNITGLNGDTTYYYRYYCTSSAGTNWASPSSNLLTLAAPTVTNSAPADITMSSASMNGYLATTGSLPTFVWLYWGASDGKNTNNNWQHTNSFGQQGTGALTTNITGLGVSTTYYYRYYATNSAGISWAAPSSNLVTLAAPTTPVITNTAPTNVTSASACMNGNMVSTGGAPTFVWLYWGESDGLEGAWDHTNSLGQAGIGTLTMNITGLAADTEYWYRYFATNSAGTVWASPSSNLTTELGGGGGGKGTNLAAVTGNTYNWMAYNLCICSDYGTSFNGSGYEIDQYSNVIAGGIRDGFGGQTAPAHVTDYTTDLYGYRGTDITTVVGENVNNPLKWKGYNSGGWQLGTKTHGTLKDYVTGTNIPGVTVTICNNTNNDPYESSRDDNNYVSVDEYGNDGTWYTNASPDPIFATPVGVKFNRAYANCSLEVYTFNGLSPSNKYDFAAMAISGKAAQNQGTYWCGVSTVTISCSNATQASTQTSKQTGYYGLPSMVSTSMCLTFEDDDRAMWTNITPRADGTIQVTCTKKSGRDGVAFSAFVLGEQGPPKTEGTTIIMR